MTAPNPEAIQRRAVADSLFVSAKIFARLGREGAAAMTRSELMDLLDRPLVAPGVAQARSLRALELARDAGRAFARAERSEPQRAERSEPQRAERARRT